MKLKIYLPFFGLFLLLSFDYSTETLDFEFADNYCSTIEEQVTTIGETYQLKSADLLPVIYPECSRFNALSNVFEEDLMAYLYVEQGVEGADFSIGYFQMKPSFVEDLEKEIQDNQLLIGFKDKFAYTAKTAKEIRAERLTKLQSENWQIEYLCTFVLLMKERYKMEKIQIPEIQFIASAYNYGFSKPTKEIITWSKIKAFPNGRAHLQNVAYGELSMKYKFNRYGHE